MPGPGQAKARAPPELEPRRFTLPFKRDLTPDHLPPDRHGHRAARHLVAVDHALEVAPPWDGSATSSSPSQRSPRGSAGPRRFRLPVTVGRLLVTESGLEHEARLRHRVPV